VILVITLAWLGAVGLYLFTGRVDTEVFLPINVLFGGVATAAVGIKIFVRRNDNGAK
jgi:hypothetical protein